MKWASQSSNVIWRLKQSLRLFHTLISLPCQQALERDANYFSVRWNQEIVAIAANTIQNKQKPTNTLECCPTSHQWALSFPCISKDDHGTAGTMNPAKSFEFSQACPLQPSGRIKGSPLFLPLFLWLGKQSPWRCNPLRHILFLSMF